MTKYHQLQTRKPKASKRVGRGISAGQGKTAGRGTKGQNSRTGKKLRAGFMGGQRSLMQAVPKARGFKSLRAPAQVVYLDQLGTLKTATADNASLFEAGLIASPHHAVKVIARGELKKNITLNVQAASAAVVTSITKAGGSFSKVPVPLKISQKKSETSKKSTGKKPVK